MECIPKTITPSGAVSRISMTENKVIEPTGAIDDTGLTLTPEQVQANAKAEEEANLNGGKSADEIAKAEEQAKADATAKADADTKKAEEDRRAGLSDEERKAEDDKKALDDQKLPAEPLQPKPRSIYKDLKEERKLKNEAKSALEVAQAQNAEKDKIIADLTEKAKNATTPAEKKEVSDEITALAEEIGASPDGIVKLTDFLTKHLVKPAGTDISKEDVELVKSFTQTQAQKDADAKAKEEFSSEWNVFEPGLKKEFPQVSSEELSNVRKEVDRLAHTTKYHDKEIDYIYFKEKTNLEKFISPKRPSFEGGENRQQENAGVKDVEFSEKSSPMDIQKSMERSSSTLDVRSVS